MTQWLGRFATVALLASSALVSSHDAAAASFVVANTNDSGVDSLRDAIAHANAVPGLDLITFDASLSDSTITLTTGELSVTDDVMIDATAAPGVIVSAGGSSKVLTSNADLEIIGLHLRDGDGGLGGALFVGADLTLRNTTISNSSASISGGAAIVGGNAFLYGSTINENTADQGGGLSVAGSALIADGSILSANTAEGSGGAILIGANSLTLSDSTVTGNNGCVIDGHGGGVSSLGPITITDSAINLNTCANGDGGGIYVKPDSPLLPVVEVEGSTLNDNSAANGGALAADGVAITISDSTLSNNEASDDGGAIDMSDGELTISESVISDNDAEDGGGVFQSSGALTIVASTIDSNFAVDAGGGVLAFNADISIDGGSVSFNAADGEGGGVFAAAGTIVVADAVINNNGSDSVGGGVYVEVAESAVLRRVMIQQNYADDAGGGVFAISVASLLLDGATLEGNDGGTVGGGLRGTGIGELAIRDSIIRANRVEEKGGGINASFGNDVIIDGSTIIGNAALNSDPEDAIGGGIYVDDMASVTINENDIIENSTTGAGGGLYLNDIGEVNIDGGTVARNTSRTVGGLVFSDVRSTSISGIGVRENEAAEAYGGLALVDVGPTTITDVEIVGNTASAAAGLAIDTSDDVVVSRSSVSANVADSTDANAQQIGGGLYTVDSTVAIDDSALDDNSAQAGGGVLSVRSTLNLAAGTTVDRNTAEEGAGVWGDESDVVTSGGVSISDNSATAGDGGGALLIGGMAQLAGTTFSGNSATGSGGGVSADHVEVETSIFSANTATVHGGGIDTVSGTVRRSLFTENTAGDESNGGAIFARHAISASHSTFDSNRAGGTGGAINVDGDSESGQSTFQFLTVTDNVAGFAGGGIHVGDSDISTPVGILAVENTASEFPDVEFPFAPEWSIVGDLGDTPEVDRDGRPALGLLTGIDPLLGPLADNGGPTQTRMLSPRSPAIAAGGTITDDLVDQRGTIVAQGELLDVGAVQYDGPLPVWIPVTPARLVDTRSSGETVDGLFRGAGTVDADSTLRVEIAGRGDVPTTATGAIINVTAINPESVGFITVYPCTDTLPNASSLNYTTGVNLPNEVVAGFNDDGSTCIYSSARTQIAVDVVGYLAAPSPFEPIEPARLLDTRQTGVTIDGESRAQGRSTAGSEVTVRVAGRAGIPDNAVAAVINVVAIGPSGTGFVTVHACLDDRPLTSSLNYIAGGNRGNEILAGLDDDGQICVYTSRDSHLVVDVVGYLEPDLDVTAVAPARVFETRTGTPTIDGEFEGVGQLEAGTVTRVQLAGRANVATNATTVNINLTAINAQRNGFITVYPCGEQPLAASLNYIPDVNGGNDLISGLDSNGGLCVFTSSTTHLTIDITGYTTL